MFNKHLRILIIDPVRENSFAIEKMLNTLGHYCIATTMHVEEGLLLNRYGLKNFDVLIAPLPILVLDHCQVSRFKGFNIRNLLAYNCASHLHNKSLLIAPGELSFSNGLPDFEIIVNFMSIFKIQKPSVNPQRYKYLFDARSEACEVK